VIPLVPSVRSSKPSFCVGGCVGYEAAGSHLIPRSLHQTNTVFRVRRSEAAPREKERSSIQTSNRTKFEKGWRK
jgi:hypothetical protein